MSTIYVTISTTSDAPMSILKDYDSDQWAEFTTSQRFHKTMEGAMQQVQHEVNGIRRCIHGVSEKQATVDLHWVSYQKGKIRWTLDVLTQLVYIIREEELGN